MDGDVGITANLYAGTRKLGEVKLPEMPVVPEVIIVGRYAFRLAANSLTDYLECSWCVIKDAVITREQ